MLSKRLLPKVLVLLFLALLVQNHASAQGRGYGNGNRPAPIRPLPPTGPFYDYYDHSVVTLNENVFRYFNGVSSLDLKQIFRLGAQHRGMQLEQIIVTATSDAGRGQMALEINGLGQMDRQVVGLFSSRLFFFADPIRNTIGDDIRQASLNMRGNIYIESVEIHLRTQRNDGGGRGREEILQAQVWDYLNNGKLYAVRNVLGMNAQYNNRALGWVEIKGTSPHRNASARLLINGRVQGVPQNFQAYDSTLRFLLPRNANILGRDIQTVQLEVYGTVHVTEIKAGIQSPNNVPPRRPPPAFVEETMNLHLTGFQNVSLDSLIRDSRGQDLRGLRVASVEVTARARHYGAAITLCEKARGWNSGFCQPSQRVGTTATFTTHFANSMLFEDIDLQNSGELVIQKVTVRFQR